MADGTEEPKRVDLFYLFTTVYGPYAFGVLSLLLLWFTIVQPELNRRALDFDAQLQVLQRLAERDIAQNDISRTMGSTAQTMAATATILERTVDKLERVSRDE